MPIFFAIFAPMLIPGTRRMLMSCAAMAVAAVAAAQGLSAVRAVVDMGAVVFRKPTTAVFTLTNTSGSEITIEDVRTSCGCAQAQYPTVPVAAGESCEIRLTYDARTLGHFNKSAVVMTKGDNVRLTMTGLVVEDLMDYSSSYPYAIGVLLTDVEEVMFDDVNRGDCPTQVIHVMNKGSKIYTPNILHLPPYLTAVVTPEKIAPKRAGKIELTLNSMELRDYGLTRTNVYLAGELGEMISTDNMLPVSAVLLPDVDALTEQQKADAPVASLSAETVALDFSGKDKATGSVTITNEGKSTLTVSSIQRFNDGLTITLSSKDIAPGESARLKITGQKSRISHDKSKPRILMITNDPNRPKIVINVDGAS